MDKLEKQEFATKGFMNIGISVQQNCGKKYLQELLRILNKISLEEDSYLAFPTEIHLIVSEEKEPLVAAYF